jgi:uncharacterized protein (DUF2236 family)
VTATPPQPPPAGGMLWSLVGDGRMLLAFPSALALQVAHPAVGAGVDDHSVFRTDPWGRGERSLDSLQLWVYGGQDAVAEGRRLRRMHREIKGTDAHGERYHALDPDAYAWVHATGFPTYVHAQRILGRPFTPEQERRLYAEWLCVGRVLGLRERDMPQTVEAFRTYWRRMLDERLETTVVLRELVALDADVPPLDRGPALLRIPLRAAWPVVLPAFLRLRRFLTVGFLPPDARAALGVRWTPAQERRLRRLGRVVRLVAPLLPERARYLPYARRARQAWRGQVRHA